MALTAQNWPITAALLQFSGTRPDGSTVHDADAAEWVETFHEVRDAGFTNVDLTDSWLRPGDLSLARLDELKAATVEAGVGVPVISAIRRSIIDSKKGDDNLAYSHRTIDAAAHLGVEVVSFGLHQELTAEQKAQQWFWTVEGHKDPNDRETWAKAVAGFRELGRHAADVGILLSLELYEDTYLGSGASAARLIQDIGLRNVGINPDVGNLVRLHRPIDDWREIFHSVLPYTNYWHVKNYARDEDVARNSYLAIPMPMESGLINYRAVVKEAISLGFQGIFCCEHYGGDGLSVSASNQAYLRNQILPKRDGYPVGTSLVDQIASKPTNPAGPQA